MKGIGYRDDAAVENDIINRDPIILYENKLRMTYSVKDDEINEIRNHAVNLIENAVSFARKSREPNSETAYNYVFVE